MRQHQKGTPSFCLHPPHLTNFGPFLGAGMVNKNQTSTPILESNWGLGALNQGNVLPSLPQTPTRSPGPLRAPLPQLIGGPASLAQGESQGSGGWGKGGGVKCHFLW